MNNLSRGEILLGAGAATLIGLTGCEHTGSSLLPGAANATSPLSRSRRFGPAVTVDVPTGDAIQKAIDSLPPGGGTINLVASKPYVVKRALILSNMTNVTLMGRGALATTIIAAHGAVFGVSGHNEEYLMLIDGSTDVTIAGLTVNANNEANKPGEPRIGIGVWNSTGVTANAVTFANNLGPNGFNQALSFNGCSKSTASRCKVSQSRIGIALSNSKGFNVNSCQIEQCESFAPKFPGPVSGISIVSSSGIVTLSYLADNKVDAGIFVKDSGGLQITTSKISKTLPFGGHGNPAIAIEGCQGTTKFNRVHVNRMSLLHNSGGGLIMSNSKLAVIGECTIVNNGGVGIELNGGTSDIELHGNHVARSARSTEPGIKAGFGSTPDTGGFIHDDTVHGFWASVYLGSASKGFRVENNDFRYNTYCSRNDGTNNTFINNLC